MNFLAQMYRRYDRSIKCMYWYIVRDCSVTESAEFDHMAD